MVTRLAAVRLQSLSGSGAFRGSHVTVLEPRRPHHGGQWARAGVLGSTRLASAPPGPQVSQRPGLRRQLHSGSLAGDLRATTVEGSQTPALRTRNPPESCPTEHTPRPARRLVSAARSSGRGSGGLWQPQGSPAPRLCSRLCEDATLPAPTPTKAGLRAPHRGAQRKRGSKCVHDPEERTSPRMEGGVTNEQAGSQDPTPTAARWPGPWPGFGLQPHPWPGGSNHPPWLSKPLSKLLNETPVARHNDPISPAVTTNATPHPGPPSLAGPVRPQPAHGTAAVGLLLPVFKRESGTGFEGAGYI